MSWPRLLTSMALFVALQYLWIAVTALLPWRRWWLPAAILFTILPQTYILKLSDEDWDTGRLPGVVSTLWEYRLLLWPVVGAAWLVLPLIWLRSGLGEMGAAPLGGQVVNLVFLYLCTIFWLRFCGLRGWRGFLLWSSIVLAPLLLLSLVQRRPLDGSAVWPVILDTLTSIVLIECAYLYGWFFGSRARENARFLSLRRPAGE